MEEQESPAPPAATEPEPRDLLVELMQQQGDPKDLIVAALVDVGKRVGFPLNAMIAEFEGAWIWWIGQAEGPLYTLDHDIVAAFDRFERWWRPSDPETPTSVDEDLVAARRTLVARFGPKAGPKVVFACGVGTGPAWTVELVADVGSTRRTFRAAHNCLAFALRDVILEADRAQKEAR